jgi:hypothetical protein
MAPRFRVKARTAAGAALVLALAGCSLYVLTDPYGNTYGDYYNPGGNYRYQLGLCEQAIDDQKVPNADRKHFMSCCMWRNGVPIDNAASCGPATG